MSRRASRPHVPFHQRPTWLARCTRITFRRNQERDHEQTRPIRAADHTDEETTLVVGALTFAGIGWYTTGDALLANTAAAMARARQQAARDELAHELGTSMTANTASAFA